MSGAFSVAPAVPAPGVPVHPYIGYEHYGRHQAEVLVDCVTYIVSSAVGLDVGGEAIRMSPAGARTAHWTSSATTRRQSTRSQGASKTH